MKLHAIAVVRIAPSVKRARRRIAQFPFVVVAWALVLHVSPALRGEALVESLNLGLTCGLPHSFGVEVSREKGSGTLVLVPVAQVRRWHQAIMNGLVSMLSGACKKLALK